MANFVIIVDPDARRRARFIEVITPLLAPVEGLNTSSCASGDFHAVWAAHESAPISQITDADGAAVIWGDAIPGKGFGRIDARQLRKLWRDPAEHMPEAMDGYHAGVVYRDGALVVGADLTGMFPIQYFADGNVLLVASSPELFRKHPLFRAELDPEGLVGILLLMHSVGGKTMLRGVQRLAGGHLLYWRAGNAVRELKQYDLPCSDRYFDLPFSAHLEIAEHALDQALTRHVLDGQRHALFLSGGLDSRMLGGFLKRKGQRDITLLSLGQPSDVEMRCAIPVARTLGYDHQMADPSFDEYPSFADLQAKWEHGINGFNHVMRWADHRVLRDIAPRVITGHNGNPVLGGTNLSQSYSPAEMRYTFAATFATANAWGLAPDLLRKLLRPEVFGDLVDETIHRIHADYESHGERDSYRALRFEFFNRARFHIGSNAWSLSFGAWPILPYVDRHLMESMAAVPVASISGRRLQEDLLATRFPELAELPLDRNLNDTFPIRPRFRWQLAWYLYRRPIHALRQSLHRGERRYYYRIYDFNNPGWVAIRQQAELYRDRVAPLFNMDVLAELLPPPGVALNLEDGLGDASGRKTLLGLLLWAHEYLS